MTPSETNSAVLLTVDDLRRWKSEFLALTEQIAEIEKKRGAIRQKLEAASLFIDPEIAREFDNILGKEETSGSHKKRGKWSELMLDYVTRANRGVTFEELKPWFRNSATGEPNVVIERNFYKSIASLSKGGVLVKHKGRMFTPGAFAAFLDDVQKGIVEDTDYVAPARRYPLASGIETILNDHQRGINSSAVITAIRNDAKLSPLIKKGTTQVYNILSRLVKSGKATKKGNVYFPVQKSGEPPNAETQGGSLI